MLNLNNVKIVRAHSVNFLQSQNQPKITIGLLLIKNQCKTVHYTSLFAKTPFKNKNIKSFNIIPQGGKDIDNFCEDVASLKDQHEFSNCNIIILETIRYFLCPVRKSFYPELEKYLVGIWLQTLETFLIHVYVTELITRCCQIDFLHDKSL